MGLIERQGDLAESPRKQTVAAIKLPAVHAPIEDLLLQPVPPGHRFWIGIIDEAASPFPPLQLVIASREIAFLACLSEKVRGLAPARIFVVAVDHARHPQHDAIALILEPAKKPLR